MDCQGKQDFDREVVSVSTRYWPRGGGHFVLTAEGDWQGNEARPEVRPSATCAITLMDEDLISRDFEADTEQEVKDKVEAWANRRVTEVIRILRCEFKPKTRGKR
jgi:hypothetical protein